MLSLLRRNRDFFDSFFDDLKISPFTSSGSLMRTDIKELENAYELSVELPGYDKDDVKVSLEDGYLLIEAEKQIENDEKDKNGKFIKRERYFGSLKRSYYVGDITLDEVKGNFEKGILYLEVPKETKKIQSKRYLELK